MSKKIQNNLHYFKVSQKNPEKVLDDFYIFDKENPDLGKYAVHIREIKNILITLKTLKDNRESYVIVEKYFRELQMILGNFSNCSEFICFVNACDNTLSAVKNDLSLLKAITERYFKNRVLSELVPEEWVQAIIDTNASRKKGKCGEIKLMSILRGLGFKEVKRWDDFFRSEKVAASFSKSFSLKNVRNNLGIRIKTKKQNKKLDLIIKCREKIFICEAKHLNTSGGGQDKQISELIEIVGLNERRQNINYVSFLDGNYSNVIFSNNTGGEKLETQRKEVLNNLRKNPYNFWLNTAGFKALFSDLTK